MKEVASWPWGHNLVTFVQFDVWSLEFWKRVGRGARPSELYTYYLYSITVGNSKASNNSRNVTNCIYAISLRTRWVML